MSGKCSLEISRLIAEVHQRPELWDRQHPDHHNRAVLDRQWESVAATLGITGKATRGKWKNLKDHFRKEYKRCMAMAGDQEMSRWPYFHSMMFIRDQISHTTAAAASDPVYFSSDFHYHPGIYPEVEIGGSDEDASSNPLNCLNVEYDNQNTGQAKSDRYYSSRQDENMSDDKHFLLSLLPIFSVLSPDKKLKARIAIETSVLNIAYPDLDDKSCQQDEQNGGIASQKPPANVEKRKRTPAEEPVDGEQLRPKKNRYAGDAKNNNVDNIKKPSKLLIQ